MMGAYRHASVLLDEAVALLSVTPGGRYCDATLGGGGHARRILEQSAPDGVLIGIDRDPEAIRHCEVALAEFGERIVLRQANFADLLPTLREAELVPIDGILLDLGVSSHQLQASERGFSFNVDGPLDMRMDPAVGRSAAQLIDELSTERLAAVLRDYGEQPRSRTVARAIKQAARGGGLRTTLQLAAVVADAVGGRAGAKLHPATRTFQALRIAVNDELGALQRFVDTFVDALRPGGRVAVIAFHSLEDRTVKRSFARFANPCICPPDLPVCACGRSPALRLLTRRAVRPNAAEIERNPRSRSARLRAAEKI